jgi:hypothetical protein
MVRKQNEKKTQNVTWVFVGHLQLTLSIEVVQQFLEIKKFELQFGSKLKPKLQFEFFSTMVK